MYVIHRPVYVRLIRSPGDMALERSCVRDNITWGRLVAELNPHDALLPGDCLTCKRGRAAGGAVVKWSAWQAPVHSST
jgi:hypothetical protein